MRIRKSAPLSHSLGPAVETVRVCTNVVKSHLSLRLLRVGLEKHGLSVATLGAGMVLQGQKIFLSDETLFEIIPPTSDLGRVGSDTTSVTMLVMASTSCMILLT